MICDLGSVNCEECCVAPNICVMSLPVDFSSGLVQVYVISGDLMKGSGIK